MVSSLGLMELSDPPEVLTDPFGSFPVSDPTIILGDIEVKESSPILPSVTPPPCTMPSSSDLAVIPLLSADFFAASPSPVRH